MSNQYTVTWTVDVEVMGDHKDAAQAVADLYFQERIAAGEHGSACSFTVAGSDNFRGLGSNGTENQRKHELEFALLVCDC